MNLRIDKNLKQQVDLIRTSFSCIALTFTSANSIGTWQKFPINIHVEANTFPNERNGKFGNLEYCSHSKGNFEESTEERSKSLPGVSVL